MRGMRKVEKDRGKERRGEGAVALAGGEFRMEQEPVSTHIT